MDIAVRQDGPVLELQFNRPEKKNAISAAMYAELADALEAAAGNPAIRAIVFLGHAQVFTAGNDLEDFMHHPPSGNDSPVFRFLRALSGAEKPLLAAVSGPAIGIGTTLLLHCDIVLATPEARFRLPFTSLGLVPEAASSLLLPLALGYQRAAELLLLGEEFNGTRAHELGLVTRLSSGDALVTEARTLAAKLAALPASAVRATKRLMKGGLAPAVAERMAEEGAEFRARLVSPEAREAFAAFFERRKPDFSRFD